MAPKKQNQPAVQPLKSIFKGSLALFLMSGTAEAATPSPKGGDEPNPFTAMKEVDSARGNMNYELMDEGELLVELNDEGTKRYEQLNPENKRLARFVASQRCQNSNACKGLNACKSEENDCAGKGSCKGKGKCGFSDKNLAVRVVSEREMAEKRAEALHGKP